MHDAHTNGIHLYRGYHHGYPVSHPPCRMAGRVVQWDRHTMVLPDDGRSTKEHTDHLFGGSSWWGCGNRAIPRKQEPQQDSRQIRKGE